MVSRVVVQKVGEIRQHAHCLIIAWSGAIGPARQGEFLMHSPAIRAAIVIGLVFPFADNIT